MNSQYQHAYCQVSGTPFEQGVQQGQELSDAIRRNLASVTGSWSRRRWTSRPIRPL